MGTSVLTATKILLSGFCMLLLSLFYLSLYEISTSMSSPWLYRMGFMRSKELTVLLWCVWICLKSLQYCWADCSTKRILDFFCCSLVSMNSSICLSGNQHFSMLKCFWTPHGAIMEQAFINSNCMRQHTNNHRGQMSLLLLHLSFWNKWLDTSSWSLKNGEVKTGKRSFSESVNSCGLCTDYILCSEMRAHNKTLSDHEGLKILVLLVGKYGLNSSSKVLLLSLACQKMCSFVYVWYLKLMLKSLLAIIFEKKIDSYS